MSGSASNTDLGIAALRVEVAELRADVMDGQRKRRLIFILWLVTSVAVVALLVLYVDVLRGRDKSREFYNQRIHQLVCSVPPGDPTGDALRAEYDCGRYVRPSGRPGSRATSTTPRPSASTVPRAAGPASVAPPRTTRQPTSRRSPVPRPNTTTAERSDAPQRRVPTPRATVTRTASAPSPTPTGTQGLLPAVLCGLLGCRPTP